MNTEARRANQGFEPWNLASWTGTRIFASMRGITALLIGNFDGVHLAHQSLVQEARLRAGSAGEVVALTFEPHPVTVLDPGAEQRRLTTAAGRSRLLEETGCDRVVEMEPTPQRLAQSPGDFIAWFVEEFHPDVLVEGPDFHFGKDRSGDVRLLSTVGDTSGFETVVVEPIRATLPGGEEVVVRSGLIRTLLEDGRIEDANALLGRCWSLEGRVVEGEKRGRTLSMPTANLDHGDLVLPRDGVYAGTAVLPGGERRLAAISIGEKPTFETVDRLCEVHLLDHDGPLDDYGWWIQVQFDRLIRDQVAFDSMEALVEQMEHDVEAIRQCGIDVGSTHGS